MDLLDAFYLPHYNSCGIGVIGGIPIYFFFYLPLAIMIIWRFILKIFFKQDNKHLFYSRTFIQKTTFVIFFILILCQTISQIRFFSREYRSISHQPLSQRYSEPFKEWTDFATYCRKILPGKHQAVFITDLNLSQEIPGLFTQWALGYFLYPIDIRDLNREDAKNCLIVFEKKNPEKSIPPDYKIIGRWQNNFLAQKMN